MREQYTDTFSISFYCRPSRKSTKGDCPIQMAINLQGKRSYISLPRKADPKSFKKMMISKIQLLFERARYSLQHR